MKINSFYILILVLVAGLFFITRKLYHGSSQAWVGVAQAKDYTISSEKQATVKSIHVVQGQAIETGDTLVQLSSLKLVQDMEKMGSKIKAMQTEKEEKKNLAYSEMELIRSTQAIDINKLEKEIAQAESELKLNRSIAGNTNEVGTDSPGSPLEEKIKSLKEEIMLRNQSTKIKLNDITVKSNTDQTVLQNQIELLQNELILLQKERESLVKISLAAGVVESVPVKPGDEVDAYTKLISVLPTHPTSVIGYLQNEKNNPPIGTRVQIAGYESRWKTAQGKVIGYGAVTSLPDILQKSTAVKAFGKEVFIEMPLQNDFSTGEKILIRLWED
jgi:HlyD family secretion protein